VILDHMATGDEPEAGHLRVIAHAPRDDQMQAWKKFKSRKSEHVVWREYEGARNIRPSPEVPQHFERARKLQNRVRSSFARNVTPPQKRIHMRDQ